MVIPGYPNPVTTKTESCHRVGFEHLPRRRPDLLTTSIGIVLHFLLAEVSGGQLEVTDYPFSPYPADAVGEQADQTHNQKRSHRNSPGEVLKSSNLRFAPLFCQLEHCIKEDQQKKQLAE